MLGRRVAARLTDVRPGALIAEELAAITADADLVVCNLECCISERGERWPDPRKPFFFRAPPVAVEVLTTLGVDAVTLANNHALDYGPVALLDTIDHLSSAGIACVGAGTDVVAARRPAVLSAGGLQLGLIGVADHPADYAATPDRPGIAFGSFDAGVPSWLTDTIGSLDTDVAVVTPHWGPNMTAEPVRPVRAGGPALVAAGAALVAGHSAHVFHGVGVQPGGAVLYDLGDFLDDYAVHDTLRNDLGLLWLVDVEASGPVGLEAVPIALDYCFTRLADADEAAWITERFRRACAALGTTVQVRDGRLTLSLV